MYNFSTSTFKNSLVFNLGCGVLLGIYLSKNKIFTYRGLYEDRNIYKYCLRLFLFLVLLSPLGLMFYLKSPGVMGFFVYFFISIIIGIFINTLFLSILGYFGL